VFNWFRRQFSDRDKQKEEKEKQQQEQSPQAKEPPPTPEPATQDSAAQKEDSLEWAKAAYQNIQKRREAEAAEAAIAEPEVEAEPETPDVEEAPAPEAETVPPVVEEAEIESSPVETDKIAEPESSAVEVEEAEIESSPAETTEPDVEEVVEPESALSEGEEVETEIDSSLESSTADITEPEVEETGTEEPEIEPVTLPVAEGDRASVEGETPAGEEPEIEPDTTEETEPAPVPAWMKKSDALERLKETAIETPEPETPDIEFDEDFVWSAKVLADQGRLPEDVSADEISWLKRLRQGLGKTRRSLINQLKAVVGQGPLNEEAVMEIEALLLQADVGVEATDYIVETLQDKLREEALPPEQAIAYLKQILRDVLDEPLKDRETPGLEPEKDVLNIWLLTGVNGAGKTTTIGKLAHLAQQSGYRCLIAAADTFRAAAVEQVTVWGERSNTPVIANPGKNTDPAAVVFDAIAAAQSRDTELLLVDTAGRLQNKKNLMEELAKIRRIIDKKAPGAQVESLLVLDATLGQNGLRQAQVFSEAAKLNGAVLTKVDGSAKGGVALAVAQQLNLPIRFLGAGEGIEDLRPFSSYEFVEALLSE